LYSIKLNSTPKDLNDGIENYFYVDDFLICNRYKNVNIIERRLPLGLSKIENMEMWNIFIFSS